MENDSKDLHFSSKRYAFGSSHTSHLQHRALGSSLLWGSTTSLGLGCHHVARTVSRSASGGLLLLMQTFESSPKDVCQHFSNVGSFLECLVIDPFSQKKKNMGSSRKFSYLLSTAIWWCGLVVWLLRSWEAVQLWLLEVALLPHRRDPLTSS